MNLADLEIIEQIMVIDAREDFWAFRQYMNPTMKKGWWQREVAGILMRFYQELIDGLRPKYVLEAPPQHGKSFQVIDLLAWIFGKHPELRGFYTSFSDRLGVRANLRLQRIMDSKKYRKVFPDTKLSQSLTDGTTRNKEMLEFVGKEGFFRNTTVRGAITGEGLDLGIVDDPLKGRADAGSETIRDATWDWFTDDFFTRFSEDAGLLFILTRWHIDDPVGRLLQTESNVKVFKYPALATKDEKYRKEGEPLFPEHKSKDFILERKKIMDKNNFESLYQQNPQIVGGQIIQGSWFKRYGRVPPLKYRMIYGDTAMKTKEANDYSVLQHWGLGVDSRIYLLDQIRGKWEAPELRQRFLDFWAKCKTVDPVRNTSGELRGAKIEDKASGTGLIQEIRNKGGIPITGIERHIDKLTRVQDGSPYIESGYVWIPEEAPWVADYVFEMESFSRDDTHQYDDQVDPTMDAIKDMLGDPQGLSAWESMI
jgi:predicted phage terminase large subunit-like protein